MKRGIYFLENLMNDEESCGSMGPKDKASLTMVEIQHEITKRTKGNKGSTRQRK